MKYSKLLLFSALAFLLIFSSCKQEEISEIKEEIEQVEPEVVTNNVLVSRVQPPPPNGDGLELGCFAINIPFELNVNGTIVSIDNLDDFEAAVTGEEIIDFVYPINISYSDETSASIEDADAMGEAFASCIPDNGWEVNEFPAFLITDLNSCFDLVYPLDLTDGDGNVSTATDEEELIDLIATNFDLTFAFPIDLISEDGNTETVEDNEALFELLMGCVSEDPGNGFPQPYNDCYDYVYPFEMLDQDGNVVVINNHDDICNAMLNGLTLDHIFPLTLVNGEGEELVVNNDDELAQAWLECLPFTGTDLDITSFILNSDFLEGQTCYSINYPLEYTNAQSGETGTIDDEAAVQVYLDGTTQWGDVVVYPVTVTNIETGEQVTIENTEAYFQFVFTTCQ